MKISADGIEKALEAGREDYEQREFDRDVVAFSYIVDSIMYDSTLKNPTYKIPIERLFEILDTRTYRPILEYAQRHLGTDEVPSDFMRNLYRRYSKWLENPNRKNNRQSNNNYGAKSMEYRWELEEFQKEGWMSDGDENHD